MKQFSIGSIVAKRASLLASRAFLFLWIGQLISLLGDHFYRVGLTWYATTKVGGVLGGASLGIAMSLPMAALGIFAGVIVDRSNRFKLLVATDLVRAAIAAGITFLFLNSSSNLVLICAGAVILAVASLLFNPAIQSSLPELAEGNRDKLVQMDIWLLGTTNTLGVVGPAIAGSILYWAPITWLIGFDALSFAFSALMLMLMRHEIKRVPKQTIEAAPVRSSFMSSAKEGLRFLMKHPVLRPQFSTFPFMESASYAIPFLLPAFIHDHFNAGSKTYGLLLAIWALGRVLGMILVARTSLMQNRGKVLALNFIIQGISLLIFTLVPIQWVALIAFAFLGLPSGAAQVSMFSYIQLEIPDQMRGRVFAALTSLVTWLLPLGPLTIGALAAWRGVQFSFFSIAIIFLVGGTYIAGHHAVREVK